MDALKSLRRQFGIADDEEFPVAASWFFAVWACESDLLEVFEVAARSSEECREWVATLDDRQSEKAAQVVETAIELAEKEARVSAHEEWAWHEELRLAA